MKPELVMLFGYAAMGTCAAVVLSILLAAALCIVGVLGQKLFKDMLRIYDLSMVWYWLDRMEKEGVATFKKRIKEGE